MGEVSLETSPKNIMTQDMICLAIYGPQCESLMSHHLQLRIKEAEMLYFHSKLPDPAKGTNSEHPGNVFLFVWAYKIKCTCFENNF